MFNSLSKRDGLQKYDCYKANLVHTRVHLKLCKNVAFSHSVKPFNEQHTVIVMKLNETSNETQLVIHPSIRGRSLQ